MSSTMEYVSNWLKSLPRSVTHSNHGKSLALHPFLLVLLLITNPIGGTKKVLLIISINPLQKYNVNS